MLSSKEINSWAMLETEKASSFIKYAQNYTIEQGSKLAWNNSMLKKILPYCKNKRVAIDVGASYGFVSNELASEFQTVYSSEIIPDVRECLKNNMKFNFNVFILNHGFLDFIGKHKIFLYPEFSGHSTIKDIPFEKFKVSKREQICPVQTLDRFTAGRKDIDFIKIDVEGSELKVLKGATNTLLNNDAVLLLEILNNDIDNALRIIEFLKIYSYRYIEKHREDYLFIKD
jgi:FkbM family methyltransferase